MMRIGSVKLDVLREQLGLCTNDIDTNILFTSTEEFICCDGRDQSLHGEIDNT